VSRPAGPLDRVPEEVRVAIGDLVEACAYQRSAIMLAGDRQFDDPVDRLLNAAAKEVGRCTYQLAAAIAGSAYPGSILDQLNAREEAARERVGEDLADARRERGVEPPAAGP
jgi:hypothetical protein